MGRGIYQNALGKKSSIERLSKEDKEIFNRLNADEKLLCEAYLDEYPNNRIEDFLKLKYDKEETSNLEKKSKVEEKVVSTTPTPATTDPTPVAAPVSTDPFAHLKQKMIKELTKQNDPGRSISIYLKNETYTKLNKYIKANKIESRSKLIETLIMEFLND